MSLFSRAHDILNAKANKALDAAEKPDEMLDLSYEQMLDQITKVRQGFERLEVVVGEAGAAVQAQQRSRRVCLGVVAHGAVPDLAAGNVDVAFLDLHAAPPLVRATRLTA